MNQYTTSASQQLCVLCVNNLQRVYCYTWTWDTNTHPVLNLTTCMLHLISRMRCNMHGRVEERGGERKVREGVFWRESLSCRRYYWLFSTVFCLNTTVSTSLVTATLDLENVSYYLKSSFQLDHASDHQTLCSQTSTCTDFQWEKYLFDKTW